MMEMLRYYLRLSFAHLIANNFRTCVILSDSLLLDISIKYIGDISWREYPIKSFSRPTVLRGVDAYKVHIGLQ